jgi:hypothetical protein
MTQPPEWQPPQHGEQPPWTPTPQDGSAGPGGQWSAPPPPPAGSPWQPVPPSQPAPHWHPQQPPTGQWDYLAGQPLADPPPAKKGGRGRLIASIVAVLALVAGGVATYVAVSDSSNENGASSPEAAIRNIVSDINKSDLIGVLNDLVPGERKAIAAPFADLVKELKRTKVLQPGADPATITGLQVQVKQLKFSGTTIRLTDRVQVVELTGGTLDLSADLKRVPLTAEFLKAVFPHGTPQNVSDSQHVDIADEVAAMGKPVRIAAQQVGGSWYPSLFYTVAYQAAGETAPSPADAIPARGAASAEDAVKQFVEALLAGDLNRAIGLVSPGELSAVHDYGKKLLDATGSYPPVKVHLDDLTLTTTDIAGGRRATLSSITVTGADGSKVTTKVDGTCFSSTIGSRSSRQCPGDLIDVVSASVGLPLKFTQAQRQAVADLLGGLSKVGVDTSQISGQWFVDPVRTYLDLENELLSQLRGNDVLEVVGLINSIANK